MGSIPTVEMIEISSGAGRVVVNADQVEEYRDRGYETLEEHQDKMVEMVGGAGRVRVNANQVEEYRHRGYKTLEDHQAENAGNEEPDTTHVHTAGVAPKPEDTPSGTDTVSGDGTGTALEPIGDGDDASPSVAGGNGTFDNE